MIKSSIICFFRFLQCLKANKYTYQIWDRNSNWKSDFLSHVFLRWTSAITETRNGAAKGRDWFEVKRYVIVSRILAKWDLFTRIRGFSDLAHFHCPKMLSCRCVVQDCSNRSNPKLGISLHKPKTSFERQKWKAFVRTHRANFNQCIGWANRVLRWTR